MHFKNSQDFEKLFQQMGPLMMDLFPDQEFGPYMYTRKCRSPNRKDNKNSSDKKSETYQIRVPLKIYDPSQVKISVNDKALMTINASSEIEKETNRNGMRKSINILEETIQLPDYLLSDLSAINSTKTNEKNDDSDVQTSTSKNATEQSPKKLISKVTTKFERGELIITVPNKPEEEKVEEKKEDRSGKGPVDIQIEFV